MEKGGSGEESFVTGLLREMNKGQGRVSPSCGKRTGGGGLPKDTDDQNLERSEEARPPNVFPYPLPSLQL